MASGLTSRDIALSERAQQFLNILVERYIADGDPVGSRSLARDARVDVSPATIRNVMADLEEYGLIKSPHTSAGRVPTATGYRLFVDSLLAVQRQRQDANAKLRDEIETAFDSSQMLESASRILSRFTHMAGVVMVPRQEFVRMRQIEFMRLSEDRLLVILVTERGEVINRILKPSQAFGASELERAANFLNQEYGGRSMSEIRAALLRELDNTRSDMNEAMKETIELAEQALTGDTPEGDYVMSGQTNLLDFNEMSNIERLRRLFNAFTEKRDILHLLEACMQGQGVQIFIGEESGYSTLDECSVVTAPYTCGDQVIGVLGVIGPTRMQYERVIPIVDVTAQLLSAALKR